MVENTIQIKSRITINAIKTITITTTKTIKIQQNIMYALAIMLGILVHVLLSVITIVTLMNMLKFHLPKRYYWWFLPHIKKLWISQRLATSFGDKKATYKTNCYYILHFAHFFICNCIASENCCYLILLHKTLVKMKSHNTIIIS